MATLSWQCHLIQILYNWINTSLLGNCEYNKELPEEAVFSFNISTMW